MRCQDVVFLRERSGECVVEMLFSSANVASRHFFWLRASISEVSGVSHFGVFQLRHLAWHRFPSCILYFSICQYMVGYLAFGTTLLPVRGTSSSLPIIP
jgi:hypothetical protein